MKNREEVIEEARRVLCADRKCPYHYALAEEIVAIVERAIREPGLEPVQAAAEKEERR